jgi:methyl-accepting chemotaxis protein
VEVGVKLVADTGKSLERIMIQVAEINEVVGGIAAGAKEQATGLDEVNTAVSQMDQVTQQNSAMAEESTAATLLETCTGCSWQPIRRVKSIT